MSAVMTERIKEFSPRLMARIAGTLYLITILTGIFSAGYVSGRIFVFQVIVGLWLLVKGIKEPVVE